MTERRHVGGTNPAVLQRRGDERPVTAGIGERDQILRPADAAAGKQRHVRDRRAHAADHVEIDAPSRRARGR